MSFLKEKLKSIPQSTGVYLLKNEKGRSIYIGKAKNLRSRLGSYFNEAEDVQRPQIVYLMQEVVDVDYFVTRNEREALVLENSL
ncbi:MAG: GIY-YIG nuclease family protein, partial [Thermodesulfobacteriota bacterium]